MCVGGEVGTQIGKKGGNVQINVNLVTKNWRQRRGEEEEVTGCGF